MATTLSVGRSPHAWCSDAGEGLCHADHCKGFRLCQISLRRAPNFTATVAPHRRGEEQGRRLDDGDGK